MRQLGLSPMSLSFRLTEIEKAIAYNDVKKAFHARRDAWLRATLEHQDSAHKLADLLLELLDAFTNSCINFLFSEEPGGFREMRESLARIGTATPKKSAAANALREVRTANLLPAHAFFKIWWFGVTSPTTEQLD